METETKTEGEHWLLCMFSSNVVRIQFSLGLFLCLHALCTELQAFVLVCRFKDISRASGETDRCSFWSQEEHFSLGLVFVLIFVYFGQVFPFLFLLSLFVFATVQYNKSMFPIW